MYATFETDMDGDLTPTQQANIVVIRGKECSERVRGESNINWSEIRWDKAMKEDNRRHVI
jgi:hypothetical protein